MKWEDGIYADKRCSDAFASNHWIEQHASHRFFICQDGQVTRGSPTVEDALADRRFEKPSLEHSLEGVLIFRGKSVFHRDTTTKNKI